MTGEAKFIDLTFPYERNKELLLQREHDKEEKYNILSSTNIPELFNKNITISQSKGS